MNRVLKFLAEAIDLFGWPYVITYAVGVLFVIAAIGTLISVYLIYY